VGRSTNPKGSRHFQRLAHVMGDHTITENMVKHAYRSGIGPRVASMKDVADPESLKSAADHYRSLLGTDNGSHRSMRQVWRDCRADPLLLPLFLEILGKPVIPEYVAKGYADHLRNGLADLFNASDDEAQDRLTNSFASFSDELIQRSAEGHLADDPTYALHDAQVRRRAELNIGDELQHAGDNPRFKERIEAPHELDLANQEILSTHRSMSLASTGHGLPSGESLEDLKANLVGLVRDTNPLWANIPQHTDPEHLGTFLADIPNKRALMEYLDTHHSFPSSVTTQIHLRLFQVSRYFPRGISPTDLETVLVELTAQMLHEYLTCHDGTGSIPESIHG